MNQFEHPEIKDIPLTEVLAALGDPVRLELVQLLAQNAGEMRWGEFAFEINKATLSYHVKTLRLAGIIQHRKEGTRCFVALRRDLEDFYPGLLAAILKACKESSEFLVGPGHSLKTCKTPALDEQ